ncbi:TonB-dependent receptor [Pseudoalteromonas piscicida]|uniref:TonB-dependent receptor n=1 Tax=Pseudoalteromonas piscicida TaxID=43662 RepID=A0AAQ2EY60_PSEO7|nr:MULTISPECIES: TonB-dependent receptor [Pseudoalteromonas]KJY92495.1 TonB-dependent receptor [Pseudoalteromonas piscicida]TMN38205.1 TonB-dependent receptor [Pseudoalteromonas piscicida]TMN39524.1 TonB-dependent receptor [Pseudoalteromonas piscicida]TMN50297.1 TonB-dependent receptor [Pseudoalteromonas piscicida]TMN52515.1 TonB-dependent receptor [Pseudoalteromonas piscicida]
MIAATQSHRVSSTKGIPRHTLSLLIAAVLSGHSYAEAEPTLSSEQSKKIERISVTATRQTENLQDVALAVTALSASELEKMNVQDLGDLASHVPNLNLHSGDASNAVIYIRGIGQIDSISFNDPGVGVYLDDVYLGRVQGAFLDVVDPEQIEVLRGPQGTLYGRNTIGGAVRFSSAKPSQDNEGYVSVALGNYNTRTVKASVNGALIEDTLSGRFAIAKSSRDGFSENRYNNSDDHDKDTLAWRGSLLYQPSENFSAYLVVDGSNASPSSSRTPHRETPIYSVIKEGYYAPEEDPFLVDVNYNDLEELDTSGASLTLEYLTGHSVFKSITARREMEYRTHLDLDATPDASFGIFNFEDQQQISQEFQWLYKDDKFSLVSGLYYFNEDDLSFGGSVAPDFFVMVAPEVYLPWPVINAGERDQENTSSALYANLSWSLTEKLDVTLGARYTIEKKEVTSKGEEFFGTGVTTAEEMEAVFGTGIGYSPTGYSASKEWKEFTPKVVFDYTISDDSMVYLSAGKGFKSGGFNGRITSFAQPFEPETLWSYEIGSKSLLNNQNIRLNTAAFFNDYKNFQLSRFSIDPDTGAFLSLFENAGKATIYGAEMELEAVASDNLTLNLNLGYLGGGYDELIGDFGKEVSDERELVNSPKWNGRAGFEYFFSAFTQGEFSIRASAAYRSKTYLTVSSSEVLAQSGYTLFDMSLHYRSADDSWEASLYGKNLGDKRYRQHGFDLSAAPGVQLGYYGAPRTYGINLKYKF